MKKKYIYSAFFVMGLAVVFASCVTVRDDVFYTPEVMSADRTKTLDTIEERILDNYLSFSSEGVKDIQSTLDEYLKEPSTDEEYLARLYALYADSYLLLRSKLRARKQLEKATALHKNDEYVLLVQARMVSSLEDQKAFLEPLVKGNLKHYRLRCELGAVYAALEQYTDAVVAFDASFPFLPSGYSTLYGKQRALCYARSTISSDLNESTEVVLGKSEISLVDMTTVTQSNSSVLDFITGGKNWKPDMLAERLKNAGWYAERVVNLDEHSTRQDAALFLWHLINIRSPEDLYRYSQFYTNNRLSPIPDVPANSEYFDAVIGIVEEDIIPLIDGRTFMPTKRVSGLEFYKWLEKAENAAR